MKSYMKIGLIFFLLLLGVPYLLLGQSIELLINFEDDRPWQVFGNAVTSSKFYQSMEEGPDTVTTFIGKIDYSFQTPANEYIEMESTQVLKDIPKKIRIWIHGDKKGSVLKIQLKDANDEIFIIKIAKINWYGWKQIETDIAIEESFGGDNNQKIDKPVYFYSLILEDDPNDQNVGGSVWLKNLEIVYDKTDLQIDTEKPESKRDDTKDKKGIFFSGLASFTFDDIDTKGSTNANQYKEPYVRQSLLHQYFDLNIRGQYYDKASVDAKIRIEKGELGWESPRKDDYYNTEYNKSGFELEKMIIKGKVLDFHNSLTIGRIHPYFSEYSLNKILYGIQWNLEKGPFKSSIVGARPESTVADRYGLYVEDDEYNVYLLGIRESYRIETVTIGAFLVNTHQNNGTFLGTKDMFRGHREIQNARLYIRMGADDTVDPHIGELLDIKLYENGASVEKYFMDIRTIGESAETSFKVDEQNGTLGYDTEVINAGGTYYRYTKYDNYVIYGFNLTPQAQTVEVVLTARSNYVFSISLDGQNWTKVLIASTVESKLQGSKKIRINADKTIDVDYGTGYKRTSYTLDLASAQYKITGKTIMGFDLKGKIIDTDLHFEYNTLYEHRKYTDQTREDINLGYAAYFNLSRKFKYFDVEAQLFDIAQDYDTSFRDINTVDDNDDNDEWPDHWDDETVRFVDENNDGIPDNEERPPYRQVGLYVIEDYFDVLEDNDHNYVRDDQQDDSLPDYKYKINQLGYKIGSLIRPVRNLDFSCAYKDVKEKKGYDYDQEIKAGLQFIYPLIRKGKIVFIHESKKVRDTIIDNLVEYTDPVSFRNNLVNTSILLWEYKLIKNNQIKTKLKYILDRPEYDRTSIQNTEAVGKVSQDIPLIGDLHLIPTLFSRFNKDVSKSRSPKVIYFRQMDKNLFDNRAILELAYIISVQSKIFIAGQYARYQDYLISSYRYHQGTFVIGAQGSDLGGFQYGAEYRRDRFDYDVEAYKDGLVSRFYGHVSYRF